MVGVFIIEGLEPDDLRIMALRLLIPPHFLKRETETEVRIPGGRVPGQRVAPLCGKIVERQFLLAYADRAKTRPAW